MPKTISLVVPIYNEATTIQRFFNEVGSAIAGLGYGFEFVCVNDGSTDGTLDVLIAACRKDPKIRVIDLSRNFGKEAALTAGLDEARGDAIIPIDVDLQDPPELIRALIAKWEEGYDVVLARRANRNTDPLLKRFSSWLYYRTHNVLSDPGIPEDVGDFRLMDRKVVDALKTLPERRRFMKGLFAWVGFSSVTIDYQRSPRHDGESRFSFWGLWNLALEGITSFSTAPLRIWTYVGISVSVMAFVYLCFIVLRTLIIGVDLPGYASLLASVLFLGGVQLIGIGIIGEYIGRIYLESKQRPIYIVKARYEQGRSE